MVSLDNIKFQYTYDDLSKLLGQPATYGFLMNTLRNDSMIYPQFSHIKLSCAPITPFSEIYQTSSLIKFKFQCNIGIESQDYLVMGFDMELIREVIGSYDML